MQRTVHINFLAKLVKESYFHAISIFPLNLGPKIDVVRLCRVTAVRRGGSSRLIQLPKLTTIKTVFMVVNALTHRLVINAERNSIGHFLGQRVEDHKGDTIG